MNPLEEFRSEYSTPVEAEARRPLEAARAVAQQPAGTALEAVLLMILCITIGAVIYALCFVTY